VLTARTGDQAPSSFSFGRVPWRATSSTRCSRSSAAEGRRRESVRPDRLPWCGGPALRLASTRLTAAGGASWPPEAIAESSSFPLRAIRV